MTRLGGLRRALRRPALFEGNGELFWRDPLIADNILEAHLDPRTDDASRRPATIARSAAWIEEQAGSRRRLLDLGCGPGLYCEELALRGFEVTGVDYSERALEYALSRAADSDLPIRYELADFRAIDYVKEFDLVTLIYGGFCCLSNQDRDELLRRVRRALRPGGLFLFDAFTEAYVDRTPDTAYVSLRGDFWRRSPHLVIERNFDYEGEDVHLDRFIVVDLAHGVAVYDLWKHFYSQESLRGVLERAGFAVRGWFGDLCGAPFRPEGPWFGIVAAAGESSAGESAAGVRRAGGSADA